MRKLKDMVRRKEGWRGRGARELRSYNPRTSLPPRHHNISKEPGGCLHFQSGQIELLIQRVCKGGLPKGVHCRRIQKRGRPKVAYHKRDVQTRIWQFRTASGTSYHQTPADNTERPNLPRLGSCPSQFSNSLVVLGVRENYT